MTTFSEYVVEQVGDASATHDVKLRVVNLFFYDFVGIPIRLWDGQGILTTSTGVGSAITTPLGTVEPNEWIGTVDSEGNNLHQSPSLRDSRDGSSPRYEFGLPFIDKQTFDALRADQSLAKGRGITCYHVVVRSHEGLRPGIPMRFSDRLSIQNLRFLDNLDGDAGGQTKIYGVVVLARSNERGRSLAPLGTMTDTSIRERSRQLGIANDNGGIFISGNAERTYRVGG